MSRIEQDSIQHIRWLPSHATALCLIPAIRFARVESRNKHDVCLTTPTFYVMRCRLALLRTSVKGKTDGFGRLIIARVSDHGGKPIQ